MQEVAGEGAKPFSEWSLACREEVRGYATVSKTHDVRDDLSKQRLLVVEVLVDGLLRDRRCGCHLIHARTDEAIGKEHLLGRLEDRGSLPSCAGETLRIVGRDQGVHRINSAGRYEDRRYQQPVPRRCDASARASG